MRRLALAAVCGTLVLAACSDQSRSPTEPSAPPPPAENFGTTCTHGRYPAASVASLIPAAFPVPPSSNKALRAEALLRVAGIAILWDFCQDRVARQAALKTITWLYLRPQSAGRDALIAAILNGFGGSSAPVEDFVSGVYMPGTDGQIFTTFGGRATLELGACAFTLPTLITVRRITDPTFRLAGYPPDRQDQPYWDYDATNSSTNNTVATHTVKSCTPGGLPDATMAFCFRDTGEGQAVYPYPGARIGHNPVGGGPPVFEFANEVIPVPPELQDALTACQPPEILGPASRGGGLSGLAHLTWSTAGHYLARLARNLFLPTPLRAAMVGTLGPIAGKPVSLSPFGIVLPDCQDTYGYYTIFCFDQID